MMRGTFFAFFFLLCQVSAPQARDFPTDIAQQILAGAMAPVDSEAQTQRAFRSLTQSLAELDGADIAVVLPERAIVAHVARGVAQFRGAAIQNLDLSLEPGRFAISFDAELTDEDFEIDASLAGSVAIAVEDGALRFLPSIEAIELRRISFGDSLHEEAAAAVLRRVLPQMPENLSAVLTELVDPIAIDVDVFDLDVQAALQGQPLVRSATGPRLQFSLEPESPAVFVTPEAIYVLADMPGSASGTGGAVEPDYESIRAAVLGMVSDLAGERLAQGGVAIRLAAVSDYLNATLGNWTAPMTADIASDAPLPVQFRESIELAAHPNYTCAPIRSCSRDACTSDRDCSQPHDTRDCSACILRAPRICVPNFPRGQTCHGGHCIQMGNDPTCEAAKAAQNAAYEAARIACEAQRTSEIAACELRETAALAECEVSRATEVLACEARRGVESVLAEFGGVGAISADLAVTYSGHVEVDPFVFEPDLSAHANLRASASARATGEIAFTPHDIAGHLACGTNWRRPLEIAANAPETALVLSAQLRDVNDRPHLVLATPPAELRATSQPPLDAFFDQNQDLRIRCPGLSAVDLANDAVRFATGSDTHPVLGGTYEFDLPAFTIEQEIEDVRLLANGETLAFRPELSATALVFTVMAQDP